MLLHFKLHTVPIVSFLLIWSLLKVCNMQWHNRHQLNMLLLFELVSVKERACIKVYNATGSFIWNLRYWQTCMDISPNVTRNTDVPLCLCMWNVILYQREKRVWTGIIIWTSFRKKWVKACTNSIAAILVVVFGSSILNLKIICANLNGR